MPIVIFVYRYASYLPVDRVVYTDWAPTVQAPVVQPRDGLMRKDCPQVLKVGQRIWMYSRVQLGVQKQAR